MDLAHDSEYRPSELGSAWRFCWAGPGLAGLRRTHWPRGCLLGGCGSLWASRPPTGQPGLLTCSWGPRARVETPKGSSPASQPTQGVFTAPYGPEQVRAQPGCGRGNAHPLLKEEEESVQVFYTLPLMVSKEQLCNHAPSASSASRRFLTNDGARWGRVTSVGDLG